ncbi:winged helix-turn-helix transcriptional regulator [Streptomyces sp. NPDC018019]|uniref:winged helix-turn-helix transcriptional regulator n=1 Tax=Streptomyces sp. NPDC018019 TaxID=3365030 RepID=UPI0037B9F25B
MPRRRSYDQYCAAARALDAVGDRWTLLIVRELLAGPRRYTDLHADLPGISTDVLASRLKDMEREDLATRHRLPPPAASFVYELTPRGRRLQPVLTALAEWGAPALPERRPTDAVRAHWHALPLLKPLTEAAGGLTGVLDVVLDTGTFHLRIGGGSGESGDSGGFPVYGDGPAERAEARIVLPSAACDALLDGKLAFEEGVKSGRIQVEGDSELAARLRGARR